MAKIIREIADDELVLRINDYRIFREIKRMAKLNDCSIQSIVLDIIYEKFNVDRVKGYKEEN